MRRVLTWVALGALGVWLAICGALLVQRHALIYPFIGGVSAATVSGIPGASVQRVRAGDGGEILVWTVPPRPGKPVILYFTGNGGSLPHAAVKLREFTLAGFGLVGMNYRGAAGAEGAPDQPVIIADGVAVHDAIPDLLPGAPMPPVIHGTSLGAAVAVQVAARRPARAVLLEAPFARLCETAQHHYPYVPACWILPDQRWDSLDRIGEIDAPLLIQHGEQDDIIPFTHGQRLFDAAAEPKRFIAYPDGNHNDLRLFGGGIDAIRFLDALP